jgi:hypothetical protein
VVTEAAKEMIAHMLERDEGRRWSAAQLLEHEWFEVALTSPAAALGLHMVKRLQVFAGMNRCARGQGAGRAAAPAAGCLALAARARLLGAACCGCRVLFAGGWPASGAGSSKQLCC